MIRHQIEDSKNKKASVEENPPQPPVVDFVDEKVDKKMSDEMVVDDAKEDEKETAIVEGGELKEVKEEGEGQSVAPEIEKQVIQAPSDVDGKSFIGIKIELGSSDPNLGPTEAAFEVVKFHLF